MSSRKKWEICIDAKTVAPLEDGLSTGKERKQYGRRINLPLSSAALTQPDR